jgi:hypothetical protein
MEHVAVMFLNACNTLKDHHYSAPFGAHIDGLKGGIQH